MNYLHQKKENTPPRKRTRATQEQLSILEKTFSINQSPNNRVREQLSKELGMSERSIQIWFQNRRAKVKNMAKRSSMLHNETLRMQYDAANAANAACQAALFQQNSMAVDDPIKSNPDLYYYYYYYYFNQQKQKHASSFKSMSIPPPPPPPPPSSSAFTEDRKARFRAHTVGPYPMHYKPVPFQRSSLDIQLDDPMLNQNLIEDPFVSFQQQLNTPWNQFTPFFDDASTITTVTSPILDQISVSAESLQVGTWKRMKFGPQDLSCLYDKTRQMFMWCIQDGTCKFKMEFHQDALQGLTLNEGPSESWSRLEIHLLSQQVSFYMDNGQQWVQCRDFTEDKQASVTTCHQLDGPTLLLKSDLQQLSAESSRVASLYTLYPSP